MSSLPTQGACPSEMALDGYVLAGKPVGDPLAAHLAGCARCQARLAELERQTQAFLDHDYPATLERVLEVSSSPAPSPSKRPFSFFSFFLRPWPLGMAAAGAACLLLGLWLGQRQAVEPGGEARRLEQRTPLVEPSTAPYVGLKGGPSLQVWARRGGDVFEVGEGARLRAGDLVRFVPRLPGPGYLMVLSVDAQGVASLFHPRSGERALELRPPLSAAALVGSVELDDSRGPERFFLLFSLEDFEWATVERAAREGLAAQGSLEAFTRLPLPDIEQASLLILKE